ncbi:unnamed protein product [Chondrus crispus]|uniref:Uncharacterized protein n=1 Tax=Chondrus crispus TaxID=2769 RepID=R7QC88_CHOCR|nr:unnamed protein product [Chondrus crispus]CDF35016.1 unnamed protein product [Chondrus crispus]|eukprot:XP_005714835.1 unnamed protein product [Chondrus crispus]
MTLAKAAVTVAAIETSGQPMHVQPDLSAANRGRKRKRTINGITQLDVKGDQLLPDSDTPIPDVPLLEDSDEVADVADVMESDGSPPNSFVKRRKKPNLADPKRSGKSNAKNPSPKDSSSSVAVLKTFLAHIENDEKQRKDMLEVMRSDLHLKQAHLDIEKKNTHDKTTLAKAAELRKLAEVYAGIDDKRIAKELLEESYDLIAKV